MIPHDIETNCDYLFQRNFGSVLLRQAEHGKVKEIGFKLKNKNV